MPAEGSGSRGAYVFPPRTKAIAWGCIGVVFALQTLFTIIYCKGGELAAAITSALFVAPAVFMAFTRNPYRSIGACLTIVPFLMWAGHVTCVAPTSPGLAYASVLMFGVPVSIAVGLLTGWVVEDRKDAL
jgi:hypothetical protein